MDLTTPLQVRATISTLLQSLSAQRKGYWWHLNPESNKPEGIHNLIGLSHDQLIAMWKDCGLGNKKSGRVTWRKAETLRDSINSHVASEKDKVEVSTYQPRRPGPDKIYIRIGSEGFNIPADQYSNGTLTEPPDARTQPAEQNRRIWRCD